MEYYVHPSLHAQIQIYFQILIFKNTNKCSNFRQFIYGIVYSVYAFLKSDSVSFRGMGIGYSPISLYVILFLLFIVSFFVSV